MGLIEKRRCVLGKIVGRFWLTGSDLAVAQAASAAQRRMLNAIAAIVTCA